ncbi:MAG: protein of unknown function DUF3168 [Caudoviricetes sp.]|nr:MAG: protein of unknown function DUF3168 [Caudoviricetes sp.]
MKTPFYDVCKADPGVRAVFGDPLPRIYDFGTAPQDAVKPYAVYQWVGGAPFNMLNCRPDADRASLQIDVYGSTQKSSTDGAIAIRYAVELQSYITSYRGNDRDDATKLYRTSFDLDWLVNR